LLTTERLLLRRPTPDDVDMRHHLQGWERNGIGKFVVVRLEDGIVVGRVGVQLLDGGQAELGWSLRPDYWGHGYATEAAAAVLDWYVTTDRLISLIQPHNVRSQAVARRLGAVPAETWAFDDGPHVAWVHRSAKIGGR
jgi:RimJ/RimL family protein N-acetyltransferase